LGQSAHFDEDDWYSNDVPGAKILSPQIFENHAPAVVQKINSIKAEGALVKSISRSGSTLELVQLTAITRADVPDKLFALPPDYQEDKNAVLYNIQ
jgi:glucose-6-phosphate isomerase